MRDSRKTTGCDPEPFVGRFEAPGPVRLAVPCDPPLVPEEKEFVTPDATETDIPPVAGYPGPIAYFNEEQIKTCTADWPANDGVLPPASGSDAVVPAQDMRTLFYFQNAGVLTSLELNYTALIMAGPDSSSVLTALLGDPADLARLLNISLSKAEALVAAAALARDSINEQAEAKALALLDCGWANVEQVVICAPSVEGSEDPSPASTSDPVDYVVGGMGNPVTVPAGTFRSPVSQAAANEQAHQAGTTRLACRWENAEITVHCSAADFPDLDPGDPDPFQEGETLGQETLDAPGPYHPDDFSRRRINSVTIAAGTFDSLSSQEDADDVARAAALATLDCFYLNAEVNEDCGDSNALITPNGSGEVGLVYAPGIAGKGNPVKIPQGSVASATSWEDATEQAEVLALAFLECRWVNREVTYACDDLFDDATEPLEVAQHFPENYPGIDALYRKEGKPVSFSSLGAVVEMFASPTKSAPYFATVQAGEIGSSVSQDDADELAAAYALSQLACIYCNPRINPVCTDPTWLANEGATLDTVALPIPISEVMDAQGNTLNPWSIDATLGVPGILYAPPEGGGSAGSEDTGAWWQPVDLFGPEPATFICSSDPFEAATLADFSGLIPARDLTPQDRNNSCQYGNDAFYAACKATDLPSGEEVPWPASGPYPTTPGPWEITPNSPDSAYYSPRSSSGWITFSANSLTAGSKAEANNLARVIVLSQLDCFFESPALEVFCGAGEAIEDLPSPAEFNDVDQALPPVIVPPAGSTPGPGKISTDPDNFVSISSRGSYPTKGISVSYGYGRSYVSPRDAFDQAILIGAGQLDCFFESTMSAECESMPDTRELMDDGRVNGAPWLVEGLIGGGEPGQVARFKYSGPIHPEDGSFPRTINYGTAPSLAFGGGRSTLTQNEADEMALVEAASKLDCTHVNWERTNSRCPNASDILHVAYISRKDYFEGSSTLIANQAAEQYAISRTVCGECAPFRLVSFDPTLPDVSPPQGYVTKLCPGSATFWGLTPGSGMGAKLSACTEWAIDGKGIKRIYWQECGVPLPSELPSGSGIHLYWLKITCCDKPLPETTQEPALILYHQGPTAHPYTNSQVEQIDFYPDSESDTLNEEPDAAYLYLGAVQVGLVDEEDGRAIKVRQHADENLHVYGGGGEGGAVEGAFYKLTVDGEGDTYLQGGIVTGGNGGLFEQANIKVIDSTLGPVHSAGTVLYLHANCEATVASGVMLPGCKLLGISVNTTGGTNHTFTVSADTGELHTELGRWTATGFLPAANGHLHAAGCIGNFSISRL